MNEIAKKISSYSNWGQEIDICGVKTLNADDEKQYAHINRTRVRRELFMEPMLRSGALKGKRVLDLGCSYGYWAMTAATEGQAEYVLGIDAHKQSIEQGHWMLDAKGVKNCELRLSDSYEILTKLQPNSFDVVFCLGFFYHIRDPFRLLTLMKKVARLTVLDTMVNNSDEALISLRPVRPKNLLEQSVLTLELFSSPKAIYWLALESGYKEIVRLAANFDERAGIWDYRSGERMSFALSNGPLNEIFDNAEPLSFMTPDQDFDRYGLYPEISGGRQPG